MEYIPITIKQPHSQPISWETYFMEMCKLTSWRSKDPVCGVGSIIVDKLNRIVGLGYNGFARGCSDEHFSWEKKDKQLYVIHSEVNCILNSNRGTLEGCVLYTTKFPCHECAKIIIQSHIKSIVTIDDVSGKELNESLVASYKMFESAGVNIKYL